MSRGRRIQFGVLGVLATGFVLGYIAACNNAMQATGASATSAKDEKKDAASHVTGNVLADLSADALATDEPLQVAQATTGSDAPATEKKIHVLQDALQEGMVEKSHEFVSKGAEIYKEV